MAVQDDTDRRWPEVELINSHAMIMRGWFLGVKGLGILVITWTTVVLLGGFVSVLQKKDFWSLTAITLIELAWTFNYFLMDKLGGMLDPLWHLSPLFRRVFSCDYPIGKMVQSLCAGILTLVFAITINGFFAVLFILGLYISTVISLWRLIVHDYGNPDGGANLKPGLDVLYSLALLQGVLFALMNFYTLLVSKWLVRRVGRKYKLHHTNLLVSDYLVATVAGCKNAGSFAKGRNLVTYAIDLLVESKSPGSYVKEIRDIRDMLEASLDTRREKMVKQLLTDSVSFSHIVRKLLRIMHPRSGYSRETRGHAAGIAMFLVQEVRLEQFPGAIQSISSLFNLSEEYPWLPKEYHQDCFFGLSEIYDQGDWLLQIQQLSKIYKKPELSSELLLSVYTKMFLQGLRILWRLADDEGNCRIISNTEGLMSRITAPLTSIELHQKHHEEWTRIADEALPLMCKFIATPGAYKLRRQISSNGKATIRTLQIILDCNECFNKKVLPGIAVEILLDLSVDTSSIMSCEKYSKKFIIVLLHTFLQKYRSDELKSIQELCRNIHWMKKDNYIRNLAREKLVMLSSYSETSAFLRAADGALRELTNTLVLTENSTYRNRMRAAEIMEHLCRSYADDDNFLKSLKEAVLYAVPKVLTEILGWGPAQATTHAETEANKPRYSAADADLEEGPALTDHGQRNIHSSHQKSGEEHGDSKLHEALLSLCETVCQKLIRTDPDLARRFDEIASEICSQQEKPVMPFTLLVEEARGILKQKND